MRALATLLFVTASVFGADTADPTAQQIDEIIQKFAAKEAEFAKAREAYTYRQSAKIQELDEGGNVQGRWELVSDIVDRFPRIDVALLFAGAARTSLFDGAPLTLTSSDAAKAADLLGASRVVPLHVRGWAHFTEGPERISAAFADAGLSDRLRSIAPGASETF